MDVSECLSRAVEVTNDWRYTPGAAAIYDRLSSRLDRFLRLRDLAEVLNPQPAAQAVIHDLLAWIDRVDLASETGAPRPPFTTERGDAIFPDTTWWITDAGGQKAPPPVLEFDDAQDDNEEDEDDDKHEADDPDDSSGDEKPDGDLAVGDLELSQEQQTQASLASHTPTLGWCTSRSTGKLPPPALPPLVYAGYFERQLQSRCGMLERNQTGGKTPSPTYRGCIAEHCGWDGLGNAPPV
jgi:hypothetical protein